MNSKIDKVEMDPADHRKVSASGDINWAPDDVSATVFVVIAQVKPQGRIVYATGRSRRSFRPGVDTSWSADATIVDPDDQFTFGDGTGWTVAAVKENTGEIEPYPWEVEKLTIDRPAVAVPQ
jgi:hypothetical protein